MTDFRSYITERGHITKKVVRTPSPEPPKAKDKVLPTHKICTACHTEYPIEEFLTRSGLHKYAECLSCRRRTAKKRMRKRLIFEGAFLREYLIGHFGGCCARCDYGEFLGSLEFHHIDPTLKENAMSKLINQFAYGGTEGQWHALEQEAYKCVILCSNCHQALHQGAWKDVQRVAARRPRPASIPMPHK